MLGQTLALARLTASRTFTIPMDPSLSLPAYVHAYVNNVEIRDQA